MHFDTRKMLSILPRGPRICAFRGRVGLRSKFDNHLKRQPLRGASLLAFAAILTLLLIPLSARADREDMLGLTAAIAARHDDNLFRLPSDTNAASILGRSRQGDSITTTSVGLALRHSYSLQQLELEASLVDHRYSTFDYLNFIARNYAAAWHWSLTPSVHGDLTGERKETQNSFSDFTGYGTRNLRTDEKQHFEAVIETGSAWKLLGGVTRLTRSNSQQFLEEGDTRLDSAEAGLRYVFRSGSVLSYTARSGRGEFVNRAQPITTSLLDNRFDQVENEIHMTWPVTGKTSMEGRLAHLTRTHAHFAERDYAGVIGNIGVNWAISDKTSLSASLARELDSYQSSNSSFIRTNRFTLSPSWQITAKTALRGKLDYARRDYRGAVTAFPTSNRSDYIRQAMVAIEWQASQELTLDASLQNEKRTSSQPGFDYTSTIAGISARLKF